MWHYGAILSRQRCQEWYQYIQQRWTSQFMAADGTTSVTDSVCQRLWYESQPSHTLRQLHQDVTFVPWNMIAIPPAPGVSTSALTPWVRDDSPVLWMMLALNDTVLHVRRAQNVEPYIYWQYQLTVVDDSHTPRSHNIQASLHDHQDSQRDVILKAGDVIIISGGCDSWRCYQQDTQWHWLIVMYGYKKS